MTVAVNPRLRLTQIIRSPLIASYNTLQDLSANSLDQEDKNIYFGTGLAKPKEMTVGLPFDYLIMPITAEFIRRKTDGSGIIQEISDTHCIANDLASRDEIGVLAARQQQQINTLMYNLGMDSNFTCVLASDYQSDRAYKECKIDVDARAGDFNDYCRYQWAGDYYMATRNNVGIKLGWLTDDNDTPQGMDERYFNRNFQKLELVGPDYAYTSCGWNWNNNNSRVSPYTRTARENRAMLAPDVRMIDIVTENKKQVSEKIVYRAVRNMALIVDNVESLFGSLSPDIIWSDKNATQDNNLIAVKEDCDWAGGKSLNIPVLCKKADLIRQMCV